MSGRKIEAAVFWVVLPGVSWLFRHYGHWTWWQAPLIAIPCALTAAVITLGIRDTWPPAVPPEFADVVGGYCENGWRLPRVHPWWECSSWIEGRPHVHMVHRGDRRFTMVLAEHDGRIRIIKT